MRFRHYDNLRTFAVVAHHGSLAAASSELGLTKGAVSHQIKLLESQLGFDLFERLPRGMKLTRKGADLMQAAQTGFAAIEHRIETLREEGRRSVTLGLSTYLASRWLSPRLMAFMQAQPEIRLRVQPMIDLFDLERDGIDIAIRWGTGRWTDMVIEPLFPCPAFPVAAPRLARRIEDLGLAKAIGGLTLLHDRQGSHAWADWFEAAGLDYSDRADTLIIPDPNVRVQAVIDGQGVALNDSLVARELAEGSLTRISPHRLDAYGYHLAYPSGALANPDVAALAAWLRSSASTAIPLDLPAIGLKPGRLTKREG